MNIKLTKRVNIMITTFQAADILGISVARIHKLLSQDRIKGAVKIGLRRGTWILPTNDEGRPEILPPEQGSHRKAK